MAPLLWQRTPFPLLTCRHGGQSQTAGVSQSGKVCVPVNAPSCLGRQQLPGGGSVTAFRGSSWDRWGICCILVGSSSVQRWQHPLPGDSVRESLTGRTVGSSQTPEITQGPQDPPSGCAGGFAVCTPHLPSLSFYTRLKIQLDRG